MLAICGGGKSGLPIDFLRSAHDPGWGECEAVCLVKEESVLQGLYEWREGITHSSVAVFRPLKRSNSGYFKSSVVVATLGSVPE